MRWILLAIAMAFAGYSIAAEPAKCRFVRIAQWRVQLVGGLPITEGSINGKKIGVLLDTGSFATLITRSAAEKLGLFTRGTGQWAEGFGGSSPILLTRIEEVRIGDMVSKDLRVRVSGERPIPGVDLVLGEDFFQQVDLEFDYSKGVVRLFQPLDCGKDVPLSYWDPNALRLPMENERHVYVPVKLNGHEGRAMIDSGASSSIVSKEFAAEAGITPKSPEALPSYCSSGIGAGTVHSWVARFDTVAFDEETVHDARLQFADYMPDLSLERSFKPAMILGTDFLRSHRVLLARSQRRVYFSYTGGTIFPATPAIDCDDLRRSKNTPEALAALDQAIAANPKDAKALLSRAVSRMRTDPATARADLDAVIALEPSNGVALSARAAVRAAQKDYSGALADSDAAVALGIRMPAVFVARAYMRLSQGDLAGSLGELDEAIRLDPHDVKALRMRGRFRFVSGQFEAAEGDFATLLAMRPEGFDSIWLSLARERRGLDDTAAVEQGLVFLKREWPAPVLRYLLGDLDRDGLMAAAVADDAMRKGRECEARFYMGEHLVTRGLVGEARSLFEAARDGCPRDFIEYDAALMELSKKADQK